MASLFPREFPQLYPILDFERVFAGGAPDAAARHEQLCALVREVAETGVELLQYRNKVDPDELVLEDARAMRAAGPGIKLVLNDRVALVKAAGWDGVHVGQEDCAAEAARRVVGPAAIVGLSTHTDEQARRADREPVDYIAIGPVYRTASKLDTSPVIGLEGVRRARRLTGKPLVAIGGITPENAGAVCEAGADAVAVIAAIFGPGRSAEQSVRDFLAILK